MEIWPLLAQTAASDPPASFWYWVLGLFTAAIVAMWGALVWFVKNQSKDGAAREGKMARAIGEMEQFQRTVLLSMVKTNADAMMAHATALGQNTQATQELKLEIHSLRMEARASRDRARQAGRERGQGGGEDDSGIHP